MLAIICLYVFTIFMVYQSFPPILSLLIKDLGLSHSEAGLLAAIFCLPGIFLTIPLSFYSTRIGMKRLGIMSIILLAAGSVVVASANSFSMLLAGRIIAGLGAVALPFAGLEAVAQWFAEYRTGFAMGIYSTCMLGGVIVSLSTFGTVGVNLGWQASIWITVGVCAVALILYATVFKNPPLHDEQASGQVSHPARQLFSLGWPVWILGMCWALFNLANISVVTFSPDLMYQNGFNLGLAGFFTSIMLIVTVILSPFTGHLLDRMRYKELLNLIGSVFCVVLSFLMPGNIGVIVLIIIGMGIATTPFASVTFAMVPTLVKPGMLAMAYAVVTTLCNAAFLIGPYLTGFIRDATGSYTYSYQVIALFYLMVTLLTGASLLMQLKRNRAAQG